jgi:hypothetical protein
MGCAPNHPKIKKKLKKEKNKHSKNIKLKRPKKYENPKNFSKNPNINGNNKGIINANAITKIPPNLSGIERNIA